MRVVVPQYKILIQAIEVQTSDNKAHPMYQLHLATIAK